MCPWCTLCCQGNRCVCKGTTLNTPVRVSCATLSCSQENHTIRCQGNKRWTYVVFTSSCQLAAWCAFPLTVWVRKNGQGSAWSNDAFDPPWPVMQHGTCISICRGREHSGEEGSTAAEKNVQIWPVWFHGHPVCTGVRVINICISWFHNMIFTWLSHDTHMTRLSFDCHMTLTWLPSGTTPFHMDSLLCEAWMARMAGRNCHSEMYCWAWRRSNSTPTSLLRCVCVCVCVCVCISCVYVWMCICVCACAMHYVCACVEPPTVAVLLCQWPHSNATDTTDLHNVTFSHKEPPTACIQRIPCPRGTSHRIFT